jgi:putative transposase
VVAGMMPGMGALARSVDKTAMKPGDSERAAIREMVKSARQRGLDITGPDGLLKLLTKTVLETALEEEMTEHLSIKWIRQARPRRPGRG